MSEKKIPNSRNNPSETISSKNIRRKKTGSQGLYQQLAKPLCFLLLLIMVCSFLAHYLTGSETLEEYAQNNPELAYGSQTETGDPSEVSSGDEAPHISNAANKTQSPAKSPDESTSPASSSYNRAESVSSGESDASSLDDTKNASGEAPQTGTGNGTTASEKENNELNPDPNRVTYQPGFFYEPLNDTIKQRITGISYPVVKSQASETAVSAVNMIADDTAPAVSYDDLRYVRILHYDFNGSKQEGELICNKAIAQDMVEIFYELYRNEYQIEKICLVDEYSGDDTLSMLDNNTSCFNYRVVDGTDSLSKHAYGLAIDINPFYNPYIVFGKGENGGDYISPAGSEIYADRSKNFAYKIDENDLCYRLFTEHGFTWGGDWNSCKDYQHFQKAVE